MLHSGRLFVLYLLACAFLLCTVSSLHAQSSSRRVVHEKRHSYVQFPEDKSYNLKEFLGYSDDQMKDLLLSLPGHIGKAVEEIPKALSVETLPVCPKSTIKHIPTQHYSLASRAIDYIFYDANNTDEVMKAEHWRRRAVAYKAGETLTMDKKDFDIRPVFGKMMQVECLPTRLHFTTYGDVRYLEYRQGPHAWDRLPKDPKK